jgi:hypothetical protein
VVKYPGANDDKYLGDSQEKNQKWKT